MPIPGWRASTTSWATPLPGWPQPVAPPDYDAINAARLKRAVSVSLNDFTASNVDQAGTQEQITLGGLDGWWSSARDATSTEPHPTGDGDIGFRLREQARIITIPGTIKTGYRNADAGRLLTLMDDVNAQTRSGTLLVKEHMRGIHREIDVRRQSLQMTPLGHAYAIFTLVLTADDPLRYGSAAQELPQGVETMVANAGDAERCYPIIEWHGAATNPGVDFGRLTWRLGRNTFAGDHTVVDCRNGDVYRNGSRIFPTWSGYWPYIPGGSTWGFTPVGADMTFRRKSAWN